MLLSPCPLSKNNNKMSLGEDKAKEKEKKNEKIPFFVDLLVKQN